MTPLQEYIKANGTAKVTEELGISVFEHPSLPLVGFQYSQLDSPKAHPVVRWSRGTVLEKDTWKLIAQPMLRFYNYGENQDDLKAFDWTDFVATEKADGSLCILYHYANQWHLNTSGSFGLCRYSRDETITETWQDLFWRTFAQCGGNVCNLDERLTYVFELCSPQTQVVKIHAKPIVYLLTIFCGEIEASWADTAEEQKALGIQTVPSFGPFKDIDEIKAFIAQRAEHEPAFEGFVLRDKKNVRFKIKSHSYLALHHLFDKGEVQKNRMIELALANEGDEVLIYLPELEDQYKEVKATLDAAFDELLATWESAKGITDQKTFALTIKATKAGKHAGLLFALRKMPEAAQTRSTLRMMWRDASDLILKNWNK